MAYVTINFKTKKAFREAVQRGDKIQLQVPMLGTAVKDGVEYVEGPHSPQPHRWYARCRVKDGFITEVK